MIDTEIKYNYQRDHLVKYFPIYQNLAWLVAGLRVRLTLALPCFALVLN